MSTATVSQVGAVARTAVVAGISVVPPKEDGTKRPDGAWKSYQTTPPSVDQVERWYGPRTGVGFVTGAVSGGLELFELDADFHAEFRSTADAVGLGPLLDRIEAGYLERSPGGGWHLLYYCDEIQGNTKLAQKPGPPDPKTGRPTIEVLIETRGEGGYAVVAPSGGSVHPSGGRYEMISGGVETIATIHGGERAQLFDLARTFDRMPDQRQDTRGHAERQSTSTREAAETRPGDDYNAQVTWDEVIGSRGWKKLYTRGDTTYWRRPDKSEGWSATTNRNGSGLLWVFSTSTEFEANRSYDKFGAYAVLEAGGNLVSAAKTLAEQGYGARRQRANSRRVAHQPGALPRGGGDGHAYTIPITPAEGPQGPNEADDDPHRLARIYRDEKCFHQDGPTLVYHRGEFLRWDVAYRPMLEKDIRAELAATCKVKFDRINIAAIETHTGEKGPPKVAKVTNGLVNNVALALAGYTLLQGQVDAPAWLCEGSPWPATEILPTRNGLLHLPSFVAGKAAMIPPTPNFFCPYATDYNFDPKPQHASVWHELLLKIWPHDPESIASLQEWFGYHLTADVRHQKIGVIIGPRRSGKGTIARVLTAMIGRSNVCNPTLSGLGTQFGSAVLIGKLGAIITDARISGRSDIAQVVENLLSISGEDNKTIHRKHLPDWDGKLMAKFTIISNEIPRLADSSGALAGRMIILKLTRSFYGQEDLDLYEKLTLRQESSGEEEETRNSETFHWNPAGERIPPGRARPAAGSESCVGRGDPHREA